MKKRGENAVTKTQPRTKAGQAPPQHRPGSAPRERKIAATPKDTLAAQGRTPEARRAPRERGVGPLPNAQKPKLVRDVHGNELKDLFQIFPDLQRVPRRAARVPSRIARRR